MIPNLYILAGAAAVSVAVGFGSGWKVQGWRKDAAITDMVEAANELRAEREEILEHLATVTEARELAAAEAAAEREDLTRAVAAARGREVIRYVEKEAADPPPAECGLDPDWVHIHDRAALNTNRLPEAEGAATGPDEGATRAAALAGVTSNYATCHEIRDQLSALQDWVAAGL